MNSQTTLIYDGTHIKVYAQIYDSYSLFITFNNNGELNLPPGRFWGDRFFEKLRISSIGIVVSQPNWFPPEEMREIASLVSEYTNNHKVITYGTSMGAYGALKFGKLLNADVVLAFSPQWSINPEDVSSFDSKYMVHYDPELKGGDAIQQEDIGKENFIFFDPYEWVDAQHFNRLAGYQNINKVIVPFTWHGSLGQFIDSSSMVEVVDLAMNENVLDPIKFRQVVRNSRRTSKWYNKIRLRYIANRLEKSQTGSCYELDKITKNIESQEAYLFQAICLFLAGKQAEALTLVQREVDKGINDVFITYLEQILRIYHNHKFTIGEVLIENERGWVDNKNYGVIFENDDVVLHYRKGASDFVLITFSEEKSENQATTDYFGQLLAETRNITAFGFTIKQRNGSVDSSIEKAFEYFNRIIEKDKKRICIGVSAGEYVAIKYSKLLQSDVTLAFNFQHLIDEKESGVIEGWNLLDKYEIQGIKIKAEELFGTHIIIYNLEYNIDQKKGESLQPYNIRKAKFIKLFDKTRVIYENIAGMDEIQGKLCSLVGSEGADFIIGIEKLFKSELHFVGFSVAFI